MYFNGRELSKFETDIDLIYFVFENDFVGCNEFLIGLQCRKAFRKQKFIKMTMAFTTDRISGGKVDNSDLLHIVEANKEWNRMTAQFSARDVDFLEKYLGCECKIKDILTKNNEDETYKIIYKLLILLSKMLYKERKNFNLQMQEKIFMLRWLVKENGLLTVEKYSKIDHKTIKKIINGHNNFNYLKFLKLCKHFEIN